MHKRFYLTIVIVLAGIIAWQVFGFKELVINEVVVPTQYVYGQEYKGFSGDETVKRYLQEAEGFITDGKLKGELSVWYFGDPDQNKDSIRIVVGAVSIDSLAPKPSSYLQLKINEGKVLRVELNPYEIFAPNPTEVNEQIRQYARSNKLGELLELQVERYVINENGNPILRNEIYLSK